MKTGFCLSPALLQIEQMPAGPQEFGDILDWIDSAFGVDPSHRDCVSQERSQDAVVTTVEHLIQSLYRRRRIPMTPSLNHCFTRCMQRLHLFSHRWFVVLRFFPGWFADFFDAG